MNIPYVMRKCTKCGRWLVANKINFHRAKKGRYGLNSQCKECERKRKKQWRKDNPEYGKQWYEANKEKIAEYNKQYRENNKDKIVEQQKQYREANKERIAERHKQYYEANKEKELERVKRWYEANKKKVLEYHKQYSQDNKERIAEYKKQYREDNREKLAEQRKQYYEANRERDLERQKQYREDNKEKLAEYRKSPQGQAVAFNARQRRRAKEEEQGTGITKDQWLEMMKFFDWRCAYSGERLTDKTRTIDHIVPLNSNGDNMIWNMVPMTRSLNSSKHANNMEEWYREQDCYDPKRLAKIYEWQEYAYNKYGKNTQYFNTNDIQIKLI